MSAAPPKQARSQVTDGVQPAYLALHQTGELRRRAAAALDCLEACQLCPRRCGAQRATGQVGVCRTGRYARIASYGPHHGEERCLRGSKGSGTIFFSMCGLRCVFCQNFDISQELAGMPTPPEHLADIMLRLQEQGCHNINLVTPDHVAPQILEALALAAEKGLRLPLVYNSSAYTTLETLRLLDGAVDIYMPDFKLWSPELAARYLTARDYPDVARAAIREMHRQVGPLVLDSRGLAVRGVLVRHLVMPGMAAESKAIMRFLAREVSRDTYVNLMDQYYPAGRVSAAHYSEINRRITREEYEEALDYARSQGLWRFDRS